MGSLKKEVLTKINEGNISRFSVQMLFDELNINEDVQGVYQYVCKKTFVPRLEITTDRIVYDVNLETVQDCSMLNVENYKEELRNYILESQI